MSKQKTENRKQNTSLDQRHFLRTAYRFPRTDERQRGFTLLLAALVSSIVLALGASIFALAQKEVTLSSIGRDSQFAFYAADAAAECALYWDFRFSYFATSTPVGINPTCDGQALGMSPPAAQYPYTMESAKVNMFQDVEPLGNFCIQVFVTKSLDPVSSALRTVIHADGYSVSCETIQTSSRALQRSVELQY